MELSVSVVVPTFNRRAALKRLLEALARQTYSAKQFEVLVIDDGSTDGTIDLLESLRLPYAVSGLTQPHLGPAEARNLGVANAQGPLILFLDDDVVPVPELLELHVATHRVEGADVVVVGPMSPPGEWPRPAWVRWEEEKLQVQYRAMIAKKYPCTARQFYTANSSLSRALFLRAGGFDAGFKRAEDVELGYRLRDLGARFVFNPWANVLHYASRSFAAWCRTPYQYGRYDVIMSREKGHEALPVALREFRSRHRLNQALPRLVTGRGWLLAVVVGCLGLGARAAARLGADQSAAKLLSGIFNALYWQGVADELGGPDLLWRAIGSPRPGHLLERGAAR